MSKYSHQKSTDSFVKLVGISIDHFTEKSLVLSHASRAVPNAVSSSSVKITGGLISSPASKVIQAGRPNKRLSAQLSVLSVGINKAG